MAKDPAFLFYPNDYIGGTMGMTFEEKGAYIELLMLQFNRGHMTKHMIGQTVGQIWDNISDKFSVDSNGLYFNERLESEQNKRKSYSESRRNNKNGTNQYSKKKVGHMTSHMENVNEDEYVINNKGAYFENQELNDLFKKWMKMCGEKGKTFAQSQIEALQMKMNSQSETKSINEVRQSLEKGWLNLRPFDQTESKLSKQDEEEMDIAIIKAARHVQSENYDPNAPENNRVRGIS